MNRDTLSLVLGAAIAVLAQLIVAPNIAIFSVMPNFIMIYVLVMAIVRPAPSILLMAFILGLFYDLLGYGPIGLMSLLLVAAAFASSRAFRVLNNDTLFMPLTIFIVSALAIESVYAIFLLGFGLIASPFEAIMLRVLPNTLYDCVFGVIAYLLVTRLMPRGDSFQAHASPSHSMQATATALSRSRNSHSKIRKR